MSVRQGYLESLVATDQSSEKLLEARAVIGFIDDLLGLFKENLISQNEANQHEAEAEEGGGSLMTEHMELSGDLDEPLTAA